MAAAPTGADRLNQLRELTVKARQKLSEDPRAGGLLAQEFPEGAKWDFSLPTFTVTHRKVEKGRKKRFELETSNVQTLSGSLESHSALLWEKSTEADDGSKEIFEIIFRAGFVVAGGSVCNMLRGEDGESVDYDLFAIDMEPEEAERRFFQMASELEALGDSDANPIDRTLNCITLLREHDMSEFQLICRKYASVTELLFSFDLAPSAVAWDGKEVYYTPEAAYAFAANVYMPDIDKRRRSFEDRICKYTAIKGFSLVLPKFAGAVVEDSTHISMPYLTMFCYERVGENCYPVRNIYRTREDSAHDYSAETSEKEKVERCRVYGALPYFDREAIVVHNVWRLLKDDSYLVWTYDDGDRDWKVSIREEEEVVTAIKDKMEPGYRGQAYYYARDMNLVFGKDPKAMVGAMIHHGQPRCEDEYPPYVESYLKGLAQELIRKAESLKRTTFTWKTSEQGTDLRDRTPEPEGAKGKPSESAEAAAGDKPALDETIFKMEVVAEAAWYGEYYRA